MSSTSSEVVWLVGLLNGLGVHPGLPIPLFCDNRAAHHIAPNKVFHERTKHLNIDCHYVRDLVQDGFLQTQFVKSNVQLADLFTKALAARQYAFLSSKLGLVNTSSLKGGIFGAHILAYTLYAL